MKGLPKRCAAFCVGCASMIFGWPSTRHMTWLISLLGKLTEGITLYEVPGSTSTATQFCHSSTVTVASTTSTFDILENPLHDSKLYVEIRLQYEECIPCSSDMRKVAGPRRYIVNANRRIGEGYEALDDQICSCKDVNKQRRSKDSKSTIRPEQERPPKHRAEEPRQ